MPIAGALEAGLFEGGGPGIRLLRILSAEEGGVFVADGDALDLEAGDTGGGVAAGGGDEKRWSTSSLALKSANCRSVSISSSDDSLSSEVWETLGWLDPLLSLESIFSSAPDSSLESDFSLDSANFRAGSSGIASSSLDSD